MQNRWLVLLILLLPACGRAQTYTTREQAIASVRQFMGDPSLRVTMDSLVYYWPNGDTSHIGNTGHFGTHYTLDAKRDSWAGDFIVNAITGDVLRFSWTNLARDIDYEHTPSTLTRAQAQALAEQFLRLHYPLARQGQWRFAPNMEYWLHSNAPALFNFSWYPVLNAQWGTLGIYPVNVIVDGILGTVKEFDRPRDYVVTGPTAPNVTPAQAYRLAAQFADYDLTQVPFEAPFLQLQEDDFGVQTLHWEFQQHPIPGDPHHHPARIFINATNGRPNIWPGNMGQGSFGGSGFGSVKIAARLNPSRRELLPAKRVKVRSLGGVDLVCAVPPVIERGHVWVRAELLRGLGLDVQATPATLLLRQGEQTLTGEQVGAKRREGGWWVGLLAVADKAGWRVTWLPADKEADVSLPAREQSHAP